MRTDKKVAILQPNYIPWKGYFDLIRYVDEFIFLDNVQYTTRDWRNRNLVKTPQGVKWLTIPVKHGSRNKQIREVEVLNKGWREEHWAILMNNYSRAPHFNSFKPTIEKFYREDEKSLLAEITTGLILEINRLLGITTSIRFASEFDVRNGRNERLIDICRETGASVYVSGPAARDYIDQSGFAAKDIRVEWFSYDGYPEYHQLFPPFEHKVTILDLLFNEGPNALRYMKAINET